MGEILVASLTFLFHAYLVEYEVERALSKASWFKKIKRFKLQIFKSAQLELSHSAQLERKICYK